MRIVAPLYPRVHCEARLPVCVREATGRHHLNRLLTDRTVVNQQTEQGVGFFRCSASGVLVLRHCR